MLAEVLIPESRLGTLTYLIPEKYSSPLSLNIYGNKVAIILWAKQPYAIVIKSEEVVKGYKNYFELLWKISKS